MPGSLLSGSNMVLIACRMLYNINKSILRHNEYTAFLALSLVKNYKLNENCSRKNLLLLSLFHTLGFFSSYVNHSDQFSSEQDFFSCTKETESKYIFTCHYLENMTPIGKDAHALLTFTQDFDQIEKDVLYHSEYKSIIYLCAQVADYLNKNNFHSLPDDLDSLAPGKFDPEFVKLFKVKNQGDGLIMGIQNGTFWNKLIGYIQELTFTPEEETQLLKFLVYLLDFKSSQTLVHSINTSSYALSIGKRLNLSVSELNILFISSILHDIGKTRSPKWLLESRERLSNDKKILMQAHVTHSMNILKDLVQDDILKIVHCHHELCNGKGYPNHLTQDQIPRLARILTVADIASSLMDMRSYKESYDKDRTLQIIQLEALDGKFDFECAGTFLNYYDDIKAELPEIQSIFRVDFATILDRFNEFLFSSIYFNSESDDNLEELPIVD